MSSIGKFSETERTAAISISSNGDNLVIAAPSANQAIYIDHINLLPANAVNVTLYTGPSSTGTALSGAYVLGQGQPFAFDNAMGAEHGILECKPGQAFNINLSSGVSCAGFIRYRIYNE